MPVTFQVVGNLADFGNDPRPDVRVRVYATPGVKVGDVAVHSNVPEEAITDADGAFAVTLISLPGVWYRIEPRYGEFRPVNLAGYIPDSVDPMTGEPLPDGTVINLRDVVDESPTPGYQAIAYVGGGEGGGTGDVTTAQLTAEANARIAGDAALDVRVDVLEAADVILEGDPRLTDPRTPTAHGHVIADTTGLQAALDGKQAAGDYAAALGADDNYVTDAEKAALHGHSNKAALDAVTGVNTGDQALPTWGTIAGKPAVIAAGATQADARTAIGAGTSSLALGTTSSTAKAGDYQPTWTQVTSKPTTFAPTAHTHPVADLTATGTKDATTFLRGDNTWAVPAGGGGGGGDTTRPMASGYYYEPQAYVLANASLSDGRVFYVPLRAAACTIDRIAINVQAVGTAPVRLGVYASAANGLPGTLIADFGTVASTATGQVEATISQALPAGVVWLAAVAQGGAVTVRGATGSLPELPVSAVSATNTATCMQSNTSAHTSGALPGTASIGSTPLSVSARPNIAVRVA